ncbi:hypothetical protein H845_2911 [Komagataeibacter xylinus E25]|nr:hypothetical protein H845_2911 [Komagataeibacter xylinus E25]
MPRHRMAAIRGCVTARMFFSAEPSYDPLHLTGPAPAPVFRNPTSEAGT